MSGPLTLVAGAIAAGAGTRAGIARRTGLAGDLVDASLAHLIRMGRITAEELGSGCPDSGCGGCPSAKAGCRPGTSRGPVVLTLSISR